MIWVIAAILTTLLVESPLQASSLIENFFPGHCQFTKDPTTNSDQWPAICVRGKLHSSLLQKSETQPIKRDYAYGEGYLGLHFGPIVSIHALASQDMTSQPMHTIGKYTDSMFLQIGNPAIHRRRLSVGRFELPFGLNDRPLMYSYRKFYKSSRFWESSPFSARLTFDDLATTQVDLAAAVDENVAKDKQREKKISKETASFVARLIHDISALGGTRFLISFYEKPNAERRMSFGILTINRQQATGSFEWVRLWQFRPNLPFQQIFRFNFYEDINETHRWLFQYEDELSRHWLTTLGYDYQPFPNSYLRLSISYNRSQQDKDLNHWIYGTGIEYNLQ